eukprot:2958549-Rhodomonas_salina.2
MSYQLPTAWPESSHRYSGWRGRAHEGLSNRHHDSLQAQTWCPQQPAPRCQPDSVGRGNLNPPASSSPAPSPCHRLHYSRSSQAEGP